MRTHTTESTETKIFVEFIALINRSRFYKRIHDYNVKQTSKQNYMTVPTAIKELEKILMIKLSDGRYHQSYAVTKTQRTILSAFGMTESSITEAVRKIVDLIEEVAHGKTQRLTLDEQLKKAQDEYIKTRKHCDELASEIERLLKLQKEALAKQLLDAISMSNKSFEEIIAFITEASVSKE